MFNDPAKVATAFNAIKTGAEAKTALAGKASWFDGLLKSDGTVNVAEVVAMVMTLATALDSPVSIMIGAELGDTAEDYFISKGNRKVAALMKLGIPVLIHSVEPVLRAAITAGTKASGSSVDGALKSVVARFQGMVDLVFPGVPAPPSGPTFESLASQAQQDAYYGYLLACNAACQRDSSSATRTDDRNMPTPLPAGTVAAYYWRHGMHGLEGIAYRGVESLPWWRENRPAELVAALPDTFGLNQVYDDPKGTCPRVAGLVISCPKGMKMQWWLDMADLAVPKDKLRIWTKRLLLAIGFLLGLVGFFGGLTVIVGSVIGIVLLVVYHIVLILLAGFGLSWFVYGLGVTSGPWPWQVLALFFGRWGHLQVHMGPLMTGMLVITALWRFLWAPPGAVIRGVMGLFRKIDPKQDNMVGAFVRSITFWARRHGWLPPEERAGGRSAAGEKELPMTWWRRFAITGNLVVLIIGTGAISLHNLVDLEFTTVGLYDFGLLWALVAGLAFYASLELVSLNVVHFPKEWRALMSQKTVMWLTRIAVWAAIVGAILLLSFRLAIGAYNGLVENGWVEENWYENQASAPADSPTSASAPAPEGDSSVARRKRLLEKHEQK